MKARFSHLTRRVLGSLKPDEDATLWLRAEDSSFVRFNHGRVRQPGSVRQGNLTVRLIRGLRHASVTLTVGGTEADDEALLDEAVSHLRTVVAVVPEDPHLLWQTSGENTSYVQPGEPASAATIAETVAAEGADLDLVGILAAGRMQAGFASSRGQFNWDDRHAWQVDWSLFLEGDRAVKSTVAGADWDPALFVDPNNVARGRLEALGRPRQTVDPGRHRVWLEPAAVAELLEQVSHGGFGHRDTATHTTPLLRLARGEAQLDPRVHITEDTARGLGPSITPDGFVKPDRVPLVAHGKLAGTLVSPRSAAEYNVPTTGGHEYPNALDMAPGELAADDVLSALGTGLFVTNLWYLNFSDRAAGRFTGMTRFATFWIEDGEPVGPAEVMRFDDTVYHMLGEGLEALSSEAQLLPSTSTYTQRSSGSMRMPGALIDGVRFTL